MEGKIEWKSSEVNTRAVSREHITRRHLELSYQFSRCSRHSAGINLGWFPFNFLSTFLSHSHSGGTFPQLQMVLSFCLFIFTFFWLRKTYVIVKMFQLRFHVFKCAFNLKISSFFLVKVPSFYSYFVQFFRDFTMKFFLLFNFIFASTKKWPESIVAPFIGQMLCTFKLYLLSIWFCALWICLYGNGPDYYLNLYLMPPFFPIVICLFMLTITTLSSKLTLVNGR